MPQNNPEHPSPYTSEAEEVLSPDFPFSTVLAKQMRDALRQLFSDEESGKSGDIVWVDGDTILEALIALDPERLAPIRDSILPWLQARNILQFQKKTTNLFTCKEKCMAVDCPATTALYRTR